MRLAGFGDLGSSWIELAIKFNADEETPNENASTPTDFNIFAASSYVDDAFAPLNVRDANIE